MLDRGRQLRGRSLFVVGEDVILLIKRSWRQAPCTLNRAFFGRLIKHNLPRITVECLLDITLALSPPLVTRFPPFTPLSLYPAP
jgi:hypothetical protein